MRIVGVNWDVTTDVLMNEKLTKANMLTAARNIELEAAKERIEFNALHDSLTGLPNRRYLDEVLALHIDKFEKDGERAGLLHLDLDRFKQINDTLGHAAGDAMLVHAARVLKANLRSGDFVARVGGDEFMVLCKIEGADKLRWNELLAKLADRIIEQMHQPVPYQGHECRFGVSIGIACDLDQVADPTPAAGQRGPGALSGEEPRPQSPSVLQRCAAGRDRHHQAHRRRYIVRPGA